MKVFVTVCELGAEFVGVAVNSPDHQPRTLLMALKTSSGIWATEKLVVKP